ncbi:hypothetical protein F4808DRAFT_417846 [Astrocystis sublimbata]|nr:hypothetical protein F4808DRAFT_417846 [Astrocystis sublimbata]
MASKRTAEDGVELKPTRNKRHKTSRTDPTSGQRGAFGDLGGGTTAPGDSDLECEDDSEALAYLRSVRTQASGIPHVLVAKKAGPPPPPQAAGQDGEEQPADRTVYEDGVGDFRGYYEDGAYVACPDEEEGPQHDEEEEGEQGEIESQSSDGAEASESAGGRPRNSSADEIRDAYFTSITNRYTALRELLQTEPPQAAIEALPSTHPIEIGEWKRGVDNFQTWEGRLRATDPLPAQIAAMHKDSVLRLLRILLSRKFLRKRTQLRERTSRWVWAVLARLPDKGELDYMEVGWIRELGKRAVLLMVSLAELEVLKEHCDVADSSPGDEDEDEVDADVDEYFKDGPFDAEDAAPTPEPTEEPIENALGDEVPTTSSHAHQSQNGATKASAEANNASLQTPCAGDTSDVEMQLESDAEDGEVAGELPSPPRSDPITDMDTAKARLLAQLDGNDDGDIPEDNFSASGLPDPTATDEARAPQIIAVDVDKGKQRQQQWEEDDEYEEEEEGEYDMVESKDEGADHQRYQELDRAQVNERATLNMILTVAGEFYGQRDLLEFRNPFGGLQFE